MSTAVARRDYVQEVCTTIASKEFGRKIQPVLPPSITLERFTRVTLTAIQMNPELVTVDNKASLYNAVIRCAQDGLVPDNREAALVIFKNKGGSAVQYLAMVGGLRKVLAKHGFTLLAYLVHEHDTFDYQLGDEPFVHHKPPKLGKDRGEIVGAYALVKEGDQIVVTEVMSRDEIEKIRAISKTGKSEWGPWVNHYGEQCRKTVARRAYKQVPLGDLDERSASLLQAADAEFEFEHGETMSVEEANVSAALSAPAPVDADGPVDVVDAEVVAEGEQASFEELAETAQRNRAAKGTE